MPAKLAIKGFNGIPRVVMLTNDYRGLHGNAVKLLMALIHQYRGNNNGDLTAAFSVMQNWGFKSKETVANALQALQDAGLIMRTRTGRFMNPGGVCALYAITWQPIDECPGKNLEVKSTRNPPRKFSMEKNK
jgi:predicted transcriptional regulator